MANYLKLKEDIDRLINHYKLTNQEHGAIMVNAPLDHIEKATGRKANQYKMIIYRGEALRSSGPHGEPRK